MTKLTWTRYTIFGEVAEGLEVVREISNAYADEAGRPYQNIRVRHTIILDDPFADPPGLLVPDASPEPSELVLQQDRERLAEGEDVEETDERTAEEIEEAQQAKAADSRAQVLEMLGDLPDADLTPPENVLFVCKLNPITEDDDLELIFSRFGNIASCQIVRDYKTGASLNYAFVEFDDVRACTQAYFKMDGALVDDRRIKVDFSQSVARLWNKARRKEAMPRYDEREHGGGAKGGGSAGKGGVVVAVVGGGGKGGGRGGGNGGFGVRGDGRGRGGGGVGGGTDPEAWLCIADMPPWPPPRAPACAAHGGKGRADDDAARTGSGAARGDRRRAAATTSGGGTRSTSTLVIPS